MRLLGNIAKTINRGLITRVFARKEPIYSSEALSSPEVSDNMPIGVIGRPEMRLFENFAMEGRYGRGH